MINRLFFFLFSGDDLSLSSASSALVFVLFEVNPVNPVLIGSSTSNLHVSDGKKRERREREREKQNEEDEEEGTNDANIDGGLGRLDLRLFLFSLSSPFE